MAIAGAILLLLATAIAAIFRRAAVFGNSRRYHFIQFDDWFYRAQWVAFGAGFCSMILLWAEVRRDSSGERATWKYLALSVALALMAHQAWELRTFVRAKVAQWKAEGADRELREGFAGEWSNSHGARLQLRQSRIDIHLPGSPARTLAGDEILYRRAGLKEIGYYFYRAGLLRSPLFRNLADREYPLLTHMDEQGDQTAFLVLEPRRMFVVLPDGTSLLLFR